MKKIYIPKFYAYLNFRVKPEIKYPKSENINVNFIFKLRDIQKKPAKKALKAYEKCKVEEYYIYNADLAKQLWHYILYPC